MIAQIGQHIKCIFRNGTIVEGIVKECLPNSVQLQSLSDQSLLIILHPEEDIMMIKIVVSEAPAEEVYSEKEPAVEVPIQEKIRAKLKEVEKPIENPELQAKTISELRQLPPGQDKQIITSKISKHYHS